MMATSFNPSVASALHDHIEKRQEEMLAFVRALVEAESPSGDFEGSRNVVSLLAEATRTLDRVVSIERIESGSYGEHLRVKAFGEDAKDERITLLLGHTDTVHPRGSVFERPWREEDGRLYAPGIFDMKANCALILEALRACIALNAIPQRPVVLLLTCDEETGGGMGRQLVEEEARRAAQVLVVEPSAPGGSVKTARKGVGFWNVKAHGRAAHAGLEPGKGTSAILEIARQIELLDSMNEHPRGTSVNVGVVSGGTRANVVAAQAEALVDVRFTTMNEARRIENAMRELRPIDERVHLSVEGGINCLPLERTSAVEKLYHHAKEIDSILGFELGEAQVGGASDGNFAAAVGATVLDGLGIDGGGAHSSDEHICVEDIARRGGLLAGLIASL